MQYTLADYREPVTTLEVFLWGLFYGALLLGLPLLCWLWRSPRDGRDVLGSALPSSRIFFQGFRDLMGWVCVAVVLIGPVLLSVHLVIRLDLVLSTCLDWMTDASVDRRVVDDRLYWWGCFAAMTVLGALLRTWWLRSTSSERDVLHIAAHAP